MSIALPKHVDNATDPILTEDNSRFVVFPIKYNDLWSMYKKAESAFWTAEELDLAKDPNDWDKLTANEQHFVKHVLAFFAASDGIVNENLAVRFMADVKVPEARAFYSFQVAMETIHGEVYSLLIDTLIRDPIEKSRLFAAVDNIPCIAQKAEWAMQWINNDAASFATRLVAFACVEGIFFSGSFCAIFWLKERGLMPGLCMSNEFISRDESLHTEFAIVLYHLLQSKLDEGTVHAIVKSAVDIETEFIVNSIPCHMLGMNSDLMAQYIRFVADRLIVQLGYTPIYHDRNPFQFMERICLDGKANFFEHRESNYSKANVGAVGAVHEFAMDDDF